MKTLRSWFLAAGFIGGLAAGAAGMPAPGPLSQQLINGTVGCVLFNSRETKAATGLKNKHMAVCFSGVGDIVGAVITPKGVGYCPITGFYYAGCLDMVVCGVRQRIC